MTQNFNVAVGNISVRDFSKIEDEDNQMITCTLTDEGQDYECSDYIDYEGDVFTGAEAHMDINGILNVSTGRMEAFAASSSVRILVVEAMQAFLEGTPITVRYHLGWIGADNTGEFDGDIHDSHEAAAAAMPSFAQSIIDQIGRGEDDEWVREGKFIIQPFVGQWKAGACRKVGMSTLVYAADIATEKSLAA